MARSRTARSTSAQVSVAERRLALLELGSAARSMRWSLDGRPRAQLRERLGARGPRRAGPGPASDSARPVEVPLGLDLAEVRVDDALELLLDEGQHGLAEVLVVEDLVALGVDPLALLVDDVVVLDDALADVEVVALDAGLRVLHGLGDHARLDGHVALEAHALHERRDAVAGEALQEGVLQGEVEARRAGVALAAGAAAQLVVDAAGIVPFGADDVQAAGGHDARVVLLALGARPSARASLVDLRLHLGRVEALLVELLRGQARGVAAQLDVRAAAGHVGGDGDGAAAAGLGHDGGFLLVELGVEHLVPDAAPLAACVESSSLFSTETVPTRMGRPAA